MSPYSWFAAERVDELLPRAEWRPVFAGGLFRARGRQSWGLSDRRAAGLTDCEARAAEHGLGRIVWPDPWPTNDVRVARAMIAAERVGSLRRFALAAMRLSFLEGADLGETGAVLEAGTRAGLEPAWLEEMLGDRGVKDELRSATDAALSLAVIGVPTVAVGRELFWGDDRLEAAAAA
jgi:2-hydroxychromene-2-carboxylate isomerase